MSKQDFLKAEVEKQIQRFDDESRKHKKLYRLLRYTALGLTGLATILASASLSMTWLHDFLNMAIVVATACAGVITSIEGLRKPAELWIHERNVLYLLKDLLRAMDYDAATNGNIDEVDHYFDKLQQILGSSQEKWQKQVIPKNQNKTND